MHRGVSHVWGTQRLAQAPAEAQDRGNPDWARPLLSGNAKQEGTAAHVYSRPLNSGVLVDIPQPLQLLTQV